MARCKACGKTGLFLKLNARSLCEECTKKTQSVLKSGQITISIDGINTNDKNTSLGHEDEIAACQIFIDKLAECGIDTTLLKIEHRASNYTSLVYDEFNDFLRIEITEKTSWLSINLSNEDRKNYMNSPLFANQQNKNQLHWISYFSSLDQLSRYYEIAEHACISIPLGITRTITPAEKRIADYIFDLFVSCGADPDRLFFYTLSQEFEMLYNCEAGSIRFKAYKKKPGGYLIMDRDFEMAGIKGEKNRFSFLTLSELDCLKEKIIPLKIKHGREMSKYYKEHYVKYEK